MRKWSLCQAAHSAAETQILVGLRRAMAVQEVASTMSSLGRDNSAESLEKWFAAGQVRGMSTKVLRTMLKIAARFTAAGREASSLVGALDSKYASNHVLAWHSNLDILCQKTAVRKDAKLENSLLVWCLHCLVRDIEAGKPFQDVGGPMLKVLLARYLLKKRILSYLTKKANSAEMVATFSSVESLTASGLLDALPSSLPVPWLRDLPEHGQVLVSFLAKVMRGTEHLDQIMDQALAKDPLLPAEAPSQSDVALGVGLMAACFLLSSSIAIYRKTFSAQGFVVMRLYVAVGGPAARHSCWILHSSSLASLIWTSIGLRAPPPPSSPRPQQPSLWRLWLLRRASARRPGLNMLDWPRTVAAGKGRG